MSKVLWRLSNLALSRHYLPYSTYRNKPAYARNQHHSSRTQLIKSYWELKQFVEDQFEPSFMINPKQMFAVNQTNFDRINVYGFDYDYTLAEYSTDLEEFIYYKAVEILCKKYQYPKSLIHQPYIPNFCIRGLHYDIKRALFMKIDERHIVQLNTVYRGFQQLGPDAAREELSFIHVPKKVMDESCFRKSFHLQQLTDIFSIPEMMLLANVVDLFNSQAIEYDPVTVFKEVEKAVSEVHTENHLYNEIRRNTDKYLVKDSLRPLIDKLLRDGKQIFLLTNSKLPSVHVGMEHLLGKDWQEAFDTVIVDSGKPDFFDIQDRPFTVAHFESGKNILSNKKISELKKGEVYSGGCCNEFMKLKKWKSGEVQSNFILKTFGCGDKMQSPLFRAHKILKQNSQYSLMCKFIQDIKHHFTPS